MVWQLSSENLFFVCFCPFSSFTRNIWKTTTSRMPKQPTSGHPLLMYVGALSVLSLISAQVQSNNQLSKKTYNVFGKNANLPSLWFWIKEMDINLMYSCYIQSKEYRFRMWLAYLSIKTQSRGRQLAKVKKYSYQHLKKGSTFSGFMCSYLGAHCLIIWHW